jgi:hypothetical protein
VPADDPVAPDDVDAAGFTPLELEPVPPELAVAPDEPSSFGAAPLPGCVEALEQAIGPMTVNNGSNERRCHLWAMIVLAFRDNDDLSTTLSA